MRIIIISLLTVCFATAQTVVLPIDLPHILAFGNASERQRDRDRDSEDVDLVSEKYEFNTKDISRLNVGLEYSLASLTIAVGNKNQISGEIKYDRNHFVPRVDYDTYANKGDLKIQIKSLNSDNWDYHADHDEDDDRRRYSFNFDFDGFNSDNFDQDVNFTLPPAVPIDIELDFGLGDANIDLTGLTISELDLECGLSDVRLEVEKPNDYKCREVYIESGLGDLNAYGLGNLRSKYLNLEVGLGTAYVDLSQQTVDLAGDISVGLGSLELVLPEKANIKIRVDDSFLSSVDVDDLVKTGHKEWSSSGWNSRQPTIELDISIGLGSVDVDLVK